MTEANHSRRISNRPSKRKNLDGESNESGKKVRSCDKAGCFATEPTCCLLSLDSCSVSGYTSRWYHMSLGEHFCNNCFDNFYRPSKTGNQQFSKWCNEWASVARVSKPTIKRFVANELLPYWVKCSHRQCGKWRMVRKPDVLNPKFIESFKCPPQPGSKSACDVPEEKDVSLVLDSTFMPQLAEDPLLKNSPAASFLKRFLPEDVGVCPIDCSESSFERPDNIKPFLEGQCGKSTIWVSPDQMDEDEIEFAEQVLVSSATYLGLRNFLVAIWNLNPSEWLCSKEINKYLICRGLVRIYLLSVAEQILDLLTKKAVINFGIIQDPSLKPLFKNFKPKVLVIGAGVSGLAAASHLQNLGVDVTVFEAESDLGGRVKDVPILGSGAFFIEGLVNNPFTILSIQAKAELQTLKKEVVMFKSNGKVVPCYVASTAQDELNGLFMGAVESVNVGREDVNLYEILMQSFESMQKMTASCSESDVFNHLLVQNEIQCKVDMRNLSTLNWEFALPMGGGNAFIPNGLRLLLIKLSRSVNILYNEQVKTVDYAGNEVNVTMSDGKEIAFSKVLVTVPLTVLQNDSIEFSPPLPDLKKKAIKDLGNFHCEKLILEFSKNFWSDAIVASFSTFGIVSSKQIFEVFVDITNKKAKSTPTLVAFITQKSMEFIDELDVKEIVDECMMLLKSVFGRGVPQPTKWFLTQWRKGKQSGPYGSYLKVGSNQSAYDDMASSVDDKLYFAGEATFRNIPSTITGAYLSGLREAAKIVGDFKL